MKAFLEMPVCHFCLKSGILCRQCEDKLSRGEVSQLDLEIGKELLSLETRFLELKDCVFHKAVTISNLLIILVSCKRKMPRELWRKLSKIISEQRKVNVRIVEKTSSLKALLNQVISPAKVVSINTIWLPDGTWESSVKIANSDAKKLPAAPHTLEALIHSLVGENVRFTFD